MFAKLANVAVLAIALIAGASAKPIPAPAAGQALGT